MRLLKPRLNKLRVGHCLAQLSGEWLGEGWDCSRDLWDWPWEAPLEQLWETCWDIRWLKHRRNKWIVRWQLTLSKRNGSQTKKLLSVNRVEFPSPLFFVVIIVNFFDI